MTSSMLQGVFPPSVFSTELGSNAGDSTLTPKSDLILLRIPGLLEALIICCSSENCLAPCHLSTAAISPALVITPYLPHTNVTRPLCSFFSVSTSHSSRVMPLL